VSFCAKPAGFLIQMYSITSGGRFLQESFADAAAQSKRAHTLTQTAFFETKNPFWASGSI
jgi:hypothetical protein